MWDKIFGYVGLPLLLDLLHKLGIGGAAKEAVETLKRYGQGLYVTNKRRVGLFLILPLIRFHIIALIIHGLLLMTALILMASQEGQNSKLLYLVPMIVSMLIHVWMRRRLPDAPKYKVDQHGDPEIYPDFILDDAGKPVLGENQEPLAHPFAGQRMLDDTDPNYKVDLDRISFSLSMNMTSLAGFISSITLVLLCQATGNRGFLYLSLFIAVLSAMCLEIFIRVFNWLLVKVVRMTEKSASFVYAQAAILLPHETAATVNKNVADDLIAEQKVLPLYVRIRDICFETYLFFVLALMLFPNSAMFGWVASSLTLLGIVSHLVSKEGMGYLVSIRKRSFLKLLFVVVVPLAITRSFLQSFLPEQSAVIQGYIADLLTNVLGLFGMIVHPCEHIVTNRPWSTGLVSVVTGWIALKAFTYWKKEFSSEENSTVRQVVLFGGIPVLFTFAVVSFGAALGVVFYATDAKICYVTPAQSAEVKKVEVQKPAVATNQKEESVSSTQTDSVAPVEPEVRPVTEEEKAKLADLSTKVVVQQPSAIAPQGKPQVPSSERATAVASAGKCENCTPEFEKLKEQLGI